MAGLCNFDLAVPKKSICSWQLGHRVQVPLWYEQGKAQPWLAVIAALREGYKHQNKNIKGKN